MDNSVLKAMLFVSSGLSPIDAEKMRQAALVIDQLESRVADLEGLLFDAKRMAEFGDINEDMEDDGIGWKQWYTDVTAIGIGSTSSGGSADGT